MVLREIDNKTMNIINEIIQVASHTEMWDQGGIISPQIIRMAGDLRLKRPNVDGQRC